MTEVAQVGAIALQGLEGSAVSVEAGISRQLPGIAIVGLPDAALVEAKQRVRHAIAAMGLQLSDRFILVNLRPADLPKHGSAFDLAIALAVLGVSGAFSVSHALQTVHIGELGLDGTLRRPRGLLSSVIAAKKAGFVRVMVPFEGAAEARLVPDIDVVGVHDLRGAVNWYRGHPSGWERIDAPTVGAESLTPETNATPDFHEVIGQAEAVEALTIAAAGKHHVHMSGPPGAGKTMLASRLVTILPELSDAEALGVSSLQSLISQRPIRALNRKPPFQQPHHTASAAAVIGSGRAGMVMPGTLSLASHGVLFLDEAPEFDRRVLDALRQPLEQRNIEIHRAGTHVTLPADVQLVLAQNPCPCGKSSGPVGDYSCLCTPLQRRRYASKISGPLKDRIDIRMSLRRVSSVIATSLTEEPVGSRELASRVRQAREASRERLAGTGWTVNAQVTGSWLRAERTRLSKRTTAVLDKALMLGTLSLRGYDRTLRVAWTIADLEGRTSPDRSDISRALAFREDPS